MDFLIEYKEQILQVVRFTTLPFLVMLISLAFVYVSGRMLNITKKPTSKNIIALISIVSCYAFYFVYLVPGSSVTNKVWSSLTYGALSVIFYVTVGFKFFDRVDNLLDKIASDEKKKK